MKIKNYILVIIVMALVMASALQAGAESAISREHQIKAAFIYNFIKFIDWPEEKLAKSDGVITIGIVGNDPFDGAFEPIIKKKIKNKKLVIKRFSDSDQDKKALKECHLLYICPMERENLNKITEAVKDSCVLTVGETADFSEAGGIITFVMEDKKVRFEINHAAAKKAGLEVRSQLLRLAKRVVKEEASKGKKLD